MTDQNSTSSTPPKLNGFQKIFGLVIIGGAVTWCSTRPAADRCKDDMGAISITQGYVQEHLKSPSTAEFPWADKVKVKRLTGCRYLVQGYVDAQNGFGAMVRTQYSVEVEPTQKSGEWRFLSLSMD